MDQITEARLADLPRGVYLLAAVLTIATVYLVVWPVVWVVARVRRSGRWGRG